jgi:putative ABC transport system substrate-binding protein
MNPDFLNAGANGRDETDLKSAIRNCKFPMLVTALLFALCTLAVAQESKKVARIGFLGGSDSVNTRQSNFNLFRQGLRELGYVEDKNIVIEYRNAEGKVELIPKLVDELVQLKVDVLVTTNPAAMRAAKRATQTIPIVIVSSGDPVAAGIVDSLAKPGGNITGLSLLVRDLSGKRLELLRETVPTVRRVGVLWDPDSPAAAIGLREYEAAGRSMKVQIESLQVTGPNPDFHEAFRSASKSRVNALVAVRTSVLNRYAKRIADLAVKNLLPSMFEVSAYVEAGGLMSYSSNDADTFRRAAVFVDKILKGAKPSNLPVEQASKFEFVINLRTAKRLALPIPPTVLARADRIIR